MIKIYMILENADSLSEVLKLSDKGEIIYLLENTQNLNTTISNKLEIVVIDILHQMGISPKYKGYAYLKDAIMLYCDTQKYVNDIYFKLSQKYKVSESSIERGISRAIEIGFNRNDINYVEQLFGNSICSNRGCPTNLETITTIAERLKNVI